MYHYYDFIVYDNDFVNDSVEFMNTFPNVDCLRVSEYNFKNQAHYDSNKTSKRINPEAVAHRNMATGQGLKWFGPYNVGTNIFYFNNWHYTSRPCIWRTDKFLEITNELEE